MRPLRSRPLRFLLAFALLAATLGLGHLADQHHRQWDLTQSSDNSLTQNSVDTLKQLNGPISITVYATEQDAEQHDLRKLIREFVERYQRYKPDIALNFIDPVQHPELARQAGAQLNGEMLVEYAGRREKLSSLNEQTLTSALLRLAHRKHELVMYLDGHGERKLDGRANHDLGEFGNRLTQNGFRIGNLNLSLAQDVPENASLLVITQPQVDWMPGEADKLLRYVEHGGNLLWLLDNEPPHGLEPLAEQLGLVLTPGIVIDPAAREQRVPATWALASGYPPHAATRDFSLITVFPYARPILWDENHDWQHSVLVEAAPRGWISTALPQGEARFDKNRDTPGPAVIALALTRNVNEREQRIVAVGSGSFLANTFSGNGGNLDLGINLVNWLSAEDHLIATQPRAVRDDTLSLSRTQLGVIGFSLLLILPILLVAVGIWLWWRRRA
ncbi:MAG: GldG family protein [Nitrosomonadales bacterium]|nr:GldG family protein [Nitrosomonadales bacterium]